jgi:hypothetical protein
MDESLIGKRVKVVSNNRFNGKTGTITELCFKDNAVMIKYDDTLSKGMFSPYDLQFLEESNSILKQFKESVDKIDFEIDTEEYQCKDTMDCAEFFLEFKDNVKEAEEDFYSKFADEIQRNTHRNNGLFYDDFEKNFNHYWWPDTIIKVHKKSSIK